eukprot:TRINITY_DN10376_c0_g1_i1.p1 TRINITY_DN10376_c0_g1~~TRINITY_DN10376_c0_g1_i1.p1  ORF type:complete len:628 (+),score=139.85 TRINITY_DN10376_c0_g1_i1:54-1937(+)
MRERRNSFSKIRRDVVNINNKVFLCFAALAFVFFGTVIYLELFPLEPQIDQDDIEAQLMDQFQTQRKKELDKFEKDLTAQLKVVCQQQIDKQHEEYQQQIDKQREEYVQLIGDRNSEFETTLQESKKVIDEQMEYIKSLESKLDSEVAARVALEKALADASAQAETLNSCDETLQKNIESCENAMRVSQENEQKILDDIEQFQADYKAKEAQVQEWRKECETIHNENVELKKNFGPKEQGYIEKIAALEQALASAEGTYVAKSEFDACVATTKDFAEKIEKLRDDLDYASDQIFEKEQQLKKTQPLQPAQAPPAETRKSSRRIENDEQDFMADKYQVLVTGTTRSGMTSFLSVFNNAGFDLGEAVGTYGTEGGASHMFVPFRRVLHQVRHPLLAIPALTNMAESERAYVNKVMNFQNTPRFYAVLRDLKNRGYSVGYMDLARAAIYWLEWNRFVDTFADATFHIENANYGEICRMAGFDAERCSKARFQLKSSDGIDPKDIHESMQLSWSELEDLDADLADEIRLQALKYGYREEPPVDRTFLDLANKKVISSKNRNAEEQYAAEDRRRRAKENRELLRRNDVLANAKSTKNLHPRQKSVEKIASRRERRKEEENKALRRNRFGKDL